MERPGVSEFGTHLVFVEQRTEGRVPTLDEVRPQVRREWENARRMEANRKFLEDLLNQYEVSIDWPKPETQGSAHNDEIRAGRFVSVVRIDAGRFAHEVRPAYLELRETAPEIYDVIVEGARARREPAALTLCALPRGRPQRHRTSRALYRGRLRGTLAHPAARWTRRARRYHRGTARNQSGRAHSRHRPEGITQTMRATPDSPTVTIAATASRWQVAAPTSSSASSISCWELITCSSCSRSCCW